MNILITGGDGFIARNLRKTLKDKHNVISANRQSLNMLDKNSVSDFFINNNIDIVIHTAVSGGRRNKKDDLLTLIQNLTMFNNLVSNSNLFRGLMHFGSGAEFDRKTDIILAAEDACSNPTDYYGLSKKIIKREIDNINNFYNFRIFACFGPDEEETRFVKSSFQNLAKNQSIVIHQNRFMDFFFIDDLCSVISYYINNFMKKDLPKDINLCYDSKHTLLDIARKINDLSGNHSKNIVIEHPGYYIEYTGDNSKMKSLGIKLIGLEEGLKRCANVKET